MTDFKKMKCLCEQSSGVDLMKSHLWLFPLSLCVLLPSPISSFFLTFILLPPSLSLSPLPLPFPPFVPVSLALSVLSSRSPSTTTTILPSTSLPPWGVRESTWRPRRRLLSPLCTPGVARWPGPRAGQHAPAGHTWAEQAEAPAPVEKLTDRQDVGLGHQGQPGQKRESRRRRDGQELEQQRGVRAWCRPSCGGRQETPQERARRPLCAIHRAPSIGVSPSRRQTGLPLLLSFQQKGEAPPSHNHRWERCPSSCGIPGMPASPCHIMAGDVRSQQSAIARRVSIMVTVRTRCPDPPSDSQQRGGFGPSLCLPGPWRTER